MHTQFISSQFKLLLRWLIGQSPLIVRQLSFVNNRSHVNNIDLYMFVNTFYLVYVKNKCNILCVLYLIKLLCYYNLSKLSGYTFTIKVLCFSINMIYYYYCCYYYLFALLLIVIFVLFLYVNIEVIFILFTK